MFKFYGFSGWGEEWIMERGIFSFYVGRFFYIFIESFRLFL